MSKENDITDYSLDKLIDEKGADISAFLLKNETLCKLVAVVYRLFKKDKSETITIKDIKKWVYGISNVIIRRYMSDLEGFDLVVMHRIGNLCHYHPVKKPDGEYVMAQYVNSCAKIAGLIDDSST